MNDETMREAFEKWCVDNGDYIVKFDDGSYVYKSTVSLWEAWQSALNNRTQASAPEGEAVAEVVEVPTWQENVTQKGARLLVDLPAGTRLFTRSNAKAGEVDELRRVVAFLQGEGELDGCVFGEKLVRHKPFWWRSHLRDAMNKAFPTHDKTKA